MICEERLEKILGRAVDVIDSFELTKIEGNIPFEEERRKKEEYQKLFGDIDVIKVGEVGDKMGYVVYRKMPSDLEYPVILD